MTIELEDLTFSITASFYQRIRQNKSSSDRENTPDLEKIFKELREQCAMCSDFEPLEILRKPISDHPNAPLISILIFQRLKEPSIFKKDLGIYETVFAYVVIVESGRYAAIAKNNYILGFNQIISQEFVSVPYKVISSSLLQKNSIFTEVRYKNAQLNNHGFQSKELSSENLSRVQSPYQNYKFVVKSFSFRNDDDKFKISLGGSRISQGGKVSPIEFGVWADLIISEFSHQYDGRSLISESAEVISWKEYENLDLDPALLSVFQEVFQSNDGDNAVRAFEIQRGGERVELSWKQFFDKTSQVLGQKFMLKATSYPRQYTLKTILGTPFNWDPSFKLIIKSRNGFEIKSNKLNKYIFKYSNGEEIDLEKLINGGGYDRTKRIIVNFKDSDVAYLDGNLYRLGFLRSWAIKMKDILLGCPAISNTTSEKGELKKGDKSFGERSLFHLIEESIYDRDEPEYLICDDLGDEWADYIGISEDKIILYHAKWKKVKNPKRIGISASSFSDIFSQVQKNIGSLDLNFTGIADKLERWKKTPFYNHKSSRKTEIHRIRKFKSNPKNFDSVAKMLTRAIENPNSNLVVYVVVNFLSKSMVENKAETYVKGNNPHVLAHENQFFWHTAQVQSNLAEFRNSKLYIACQP